ncbi:MAG TPA: hypothetical protein VD995_12455 [Azospirillum sp.]|nr:hypothetical protein [Azospirillum sp.]
MNDLVIRNFDEGVIESLRRSALCARARHPQQTDSLELLREDRDR